MKNIVTSISLLCKKHWRHFLMGMVFGAIWQFYFLHVQPIMTSDQQKFFWIAIVFACIIFFKIAASFAKAGKDIIFYKTWCMIFTIIEAILVLRYFISHYISFEWI
jgi:uncharacterized membrane-anchored protein